MTEFTDGGYAPKAKGEKRFAAKHVVNKIPDPAGNGDDVYKATNIKRIKNYPHHGYDNKQDEYVYEDRRSKEELLNKWQDHISASVENSKRSKENPLFAKTYKKKAEKHLLAARTASNMMREEEEIEESVEKKNFSWGKMITVTKGTASTYPLHPEHQEKIKGLDDGESTNFRDEQGLTVTAKRNGDRIHLSNKNDTTGITFKRSHLTESLNEAKDVNRIKYTKGVGFQHSKNGGFTWKRVSSDEAKAIAPSKHKALTVEHGLKEEMEIVTEALAPDMGVEQYIAHFLSSNSPVFEGKTKSEKIKMATAAYRAAKEQKAIGEEMEELGETLRLLKTHGEGNKQAKVYKDSDWDEFRVKFHTDGKHHADADYHTDDAQDAHDTARAWTSSKKNVSEEAESLDEVSDELKHRYYKGRIGSAMAKPPVGSETRRNSVNRALGKAHDSYVRVQTKINDENRPPIEHRTHDLSHLEHGAAYDYTQTRDKIKDGHVLKLSGGATAIMYKAWPTLVSGKSKEIHALAAGDSWDTIDGGRYKKSAEIARSLKEETVLESVVNRILPEETTLEESLSSKISNLPALYRPLLEELFEALDESNKVYMLEMLGTDEGRKSIIDFALTDGE